jgi:ribosomal protein L23
MNSESKFLTEFLAETNLLLAQIDYGNKLHDIISPIKNLMLKEKELLAFSMARYCGANTKIAFFCEWYYQILRLTNNTSALVTENQEYFYKKVPIRLRGVPNIYKLVDTDVQAFVPQQLALIQNKSKVILDSLVGHYPYLSKYLNDTFLSQIIASHYSSRKNKYVDRMSVSEYLESQMTSDSFVKIALPCLVGFQFSFSQNNSVINPATVKWVMVEEALKNISLLNQINQDKKFDEFVHGSTLTEKEEFEWLQLDDKNRLQKMLSNPATRESVKNYKEKIYKSTINNINAMVFPDQHKKMLLELLDWSYAGSH